MKTVTTSTSMAERPLRRRRRWLALTGPSGLAARLLRVNADRWRRRALFYERHRDYFPRLASGRFVERCCELEAAYRGLAHVLFATPPQIGWMPVRAVVSRIK
ncbi:MAG: hypothetical protein H8K10_20750 [Nitrospira sp.]|nr:hypothetical protein [Nitrospira sp.]